MTEEAFDFRQQFISETEESDELIKQNNLLLRKESVQGNSHFNVELFKGYNFSIVLDRERANSISLQKTTSNSMGNNTNALN